MSKKSCNFAAAIYKLEMTNNTMFNSTPPPHPRFAGFSYILTNNIKA
jgi:hypothetical protein